MEILERYPHVRVAGVTFYNDGENQEYRQTIIDDLLYKGWLSPGQYLSLVLQPENRYDKNAVGVIGMENRQIGFIPRADDLAKKISEYLREGKTCSVTVNEVTGGANAVGYEVFVDIEVSEASSLREHQAMLPEPTVRIKQIGIKKLYGMYDYIIDLNEDLSIMHALNGAGKTTIMFLLTCILTGTNESIQKAFEIPFQRFEIIFSDNSCIEIDGEEKKIYLWESADRHFSLETTSPDLVERMKIILRGLKPKFISANRIWAEQDGQMKEHIDLCVNQIITSVNRKKESFLRNGEVLDTSLPYRVVEEVREGNPYKSSDEINREIHRIEERRNEYYDVGLVQRRERHLYEKPFEVSAVSSPDLLRMMTLYVRDAWSKYSVCDSLYNELVLLRRIINEDHQYSNKKLCYSFGNRTDPITFELPNGSTIPLNALSSGEKNDFIMFCELIFNSRANTIVLLDEPEISMHIAWQQTIIDELIEIAKMNNFQILVATHSPSIVGDHWDYVVEMQERNDEGAAQS